MQGRGLMGCRGTNVQGLSPEQTNLERAESLVISQGGHVQGAQGLVLQQGGHIQGAQGMLIQNGLHVVHQGDGLVQGAQMLMVQGDQQHSPGSTNMFLMNGGPLGPDSLSPASLCLQPTRVALQCCLWTEA